jgi:hypothetical protein
MTVQSVPMEAATYDRAKALSAFRAGDAAFYWRRFPVDAALGAVR